MKTNPLLKGLRRWGWRGVCHQVAPGSTCSVSCGALVSEPVEVNPWWRLTIQNQIFIFWVTSLEYASGHYAYIFLFFRLFIVIFDSISTFMSSCVARSIWATLPLRAVRRPEQTSTLLYNELWGTHFRRPYKLNKGFFESEIKMFFTFMWHMFLKQSNSLNDLNPLNVGRFWTLLFVDTRWHLGTAPDKHRSVWLGDPRGVGVTMGNFMQIKRKCTIQMKFKQDFCLKFFFFLIAISHVSLFHVICCK